MGKQHLHGEQLQMFMPAHKLVEYTSRDAIENAYFDDDDQNKAEHGPFADTWAYQSKLDDIYDKDYYHDQDYANPKYRDLSEDLEINGIQSPVTLTHFKKYSSSMDKKGKVHPKQTKTMITEGHHRLVHAYETNPDMELPVEHELG